MCKLQQTRFPGLYGAHPDLVKASARRREHRVALAIKDRQANLHIEAMLYEIDLNDDGVCDIVVTVRDPLNAGGDSDSLSTIYLARGGRWARIGARSAARKDLPADLDLVSAPSDSSYAFSEFAVLRNPGGRGLMLIAWANERTSNGFNGYRLFEIDAVRGELRDIDKWNGAGALTYGFFKANGAQAGSAVFDANIEANELRSACQEVRPTNLGLLAACKEFKR